jgi:U32 family peptidase
MKMITYIENAQQLALVDCETTQVILAPKELSRLGRLSYEQCCQFVETCNKSHIKCTLEWDILMVESSFQQAQSHFDKYAQLNFSSVRVQDPGALEYVLNSSDKKIQLVLENGNHNLVAIKSWREYVGARLERLVLSIELPKKTLQHYCLSLDCDIEFFVFGQILIFYTPRNLLSPMYNEHDDEKAQSCNQNYLEASGESEESPHKGFPLVENRHGTFMFHVKDQCLLEHLDELSLFGIAHVRVDFRRTKSFSLLPEVSVLVDNFNLESAKKIKSNYSSDVIKGYYNVNKSDVLFPKLKNHRIQRQDADYIGHLVEVKKDHYVVLDIKKKDFHLAINDKIKMISPEGKIKEIVITTLRDINFNEVVSVSFGELAVLNHHRGLVPMSIAYKGES